MQRMFGTGTLWAAATMDGLGNTIANPTQIKIGTISDVSLEFDRDIKMLYGQDALPVAMGGGKMKILMKAKFAQISGKIFNDLFFGQGVTVGTQNAVYEDLKGTVIAVGDTFTPTPPLSGSFAGDLGVMDSNGLPLTKVASSPAVGQYSVTAGAYTFNTAQTGQTVYVSYMYTYTLTNAKSINFNNIAVGNLPTFGVTFGGQFQGRAASFNFMNVVSKKLGFAFKQDDFTLMDLDMEVFADPVTNQVMNVTFAE